MLKGLALFDRFLHDGFNRCKYCQHVLYVIDDSHFVCLTCGAYFSYNNDRQLKPISLFDDTCSADPRGKDAYEL